MKLGDFFSQGIFFVGGSLGYKPNEHFERFFNFFNFFFASTEPKCFRFRSPSLRTLRHFHIFLNALLVCLPNLFPPFPPASEYDHCLKLKHHCQCRPKGCPSLRGPAPVAHGHRHHGQAPTINHGKGVSRYLEPFGLNFVEKSHVFFPFITRHHRKFQID